LLAFPGRLPAAPVLLVASWMPNIVGVSVTATADGRAGPRQPFRQTGALAAFGLQVLVLAPRPSLHPSSHPWGLVAGLATIPSSPWLSHALARRQSHEPI
jgi:hypothetical protein